MIDYHVHTILCNHATGTMEQVVRAAVAKGMTTICFLDHLTFQEAVSTNAIFPGEVPKCLDVLESMLDYGYFDVICHLQLPKKYNKRPAPPAVQGFLIVLEKIRQKDLAVGLNASGFHYSVKEAFPSPDLLAAAWHGHLAGFSHRRRGVDPLRKSRILLPISPVIEGKGEWSAPDYIRGDQCSCSTTV